MYWSRKTFSKETNMLFSFHMKFNPGKNKTPIETILHHTKGVDRIEYETWA